MHDVLWRVVPAGQWPEPLTPKRDRSRFKAGWTDTVRLLERELRMLDAVDVLLQMPIPKSMMRETMTDTEDKQR